MIEKIVSDIGDTVICDWCDIEYTNSDAKGGILFGEKSICPKCMPKALENIKKFKEEEFIKAVCPDDMTFKDFVMTIRGGDNTIKIITLDKGENISDIFKKQSN